MVKDKIIIGVGHGAEQSHYTRKPFWKVNIQKREKFLLRECPDCGNSKVKPRYRYCDNCAKKRRQRTNRENYYKRKRL